MIFTFLSRLKSFLQQSRIYTGSFIPLIKIRKLIWPFIFMSQTVVINFPKIRLTYKNSVVLKNTQHNQSFSNHLKILLLWFSEIKLSRIYPFFLTQNVNAQTLKKAKLPRAESEERGNNVKVFKIDHGTLRLKVKYPFLSASLHLQEVLFPKSFLWKYLQVKKLP